MCNSNKTRRAKLFGGILLVFVVLCVSTLIQSQAMAHVFKPAGCPSGRASQGLRSASGGVTSGNKFEVTAETSISPIGSGDNSIHVLVCFDEGLPTEQQFSEQEHTESGSPFSMSFTAKFKIPAGATTVHYVVCFDKDEPFTWATDGSVTL